MAKALHKVSAASSRSKRKPRGDALDKLLKDLEREQAPKLSARHVGAIEGFVAREGEEQRRGVES
jgi:hypothetical protein